MIAKEIIQGVFCHFVTSKVVLIKEGVPSTVLVSDRPAPVAGLIKVLLHHVLDLVQIDPRDRVFRNCHGVTSYGDAVRRQFKRLRTKLSALRRGAVTLAGSGIVTPRFGNSIVSYEELVKQPLFCRRVKFGFNILCETMWLTMGILPKCNSFFRLPCTQKWCFQ